MTSEEYQEHLARAVEARNEAIIEAEKHVREALSRIVELMRSKMTTLLLNSSLARLVSHFRTLTGSVSV